MSNYQKPSEYITFGSGWVTVDDDGGIKRIACKVDYKNNSKSNKGKAVKIFCVEVDVEDGSQSGEPIEIKEFLLMPSTVDKGKYPSAPDFRAFFGVVS